MKKYDLIYNCYKNLFFKMYGQKPVINNGQCGKMLKELTKDYSKEIICNIIELYFEKEKPDKVFHLPWIISAASINKYLPMIGKKNNQSIYNL